MFLPSARPLRMKVELMGKRGAGTMVTFLCVSKEAGTSLMSPRGYTRSWYCSTIRSPSFQLSMSRSESPPIIMEKVYAGYPSRSASSVLIV